MPGASLTTDPGCRSKAQSPPAAGAQAAELFLQAKQWCTDSFATVTDIWPAAFVSFLAPCPAGKKWIDAAVDLPFALPTSVAGLTLATVYGEEGILGRLLMSLGINVVYTRLGVAVAMIFVSFPFVVRTMQPVLQVSMDGSVCRDHRTSSTKGHTPA